MANIVVCDRTKSGISTRKRIDGVNLTSTSNTLKTKVSKDIGKAVDEFDLVYCGQCLKDDSTLESQGIHSGSMLHALVRYKNRSSSNKAGLSNADIKQIRTQLQEALANPAYKAVVENLLSNPELQNEVISAVPGLSEDTPALTLFFDMELLTVLVHPGNIRRVIENHPCFPDVARKIVALVKDAGNKGEFVRSSTTAYSLDQMSDDEESPGPSQAQSNQPITANHLAAALAVATSQDSARNQPIGPSMISPDFFQQAILQAQSSAMTNQIQRMREMGITDENVAREALQATHGDLQAALDLIFSGGFS